jgi:hypothetical protein
MKKIKTSLKGEGETKLGAEAFLVRPGKTKHNSPRRRWAQWEYAQVAIQSLCGPNPSSNIDQSQLTRDVDGWLKRNSDYHSTRRGPISRNVVIRVLEELWRRSS